MARDYMKALYDRFETPSKRASILRRAVKSTHKQLAPQLTQQQKKILLRMGDLEDALRDQCCLDSFFAGFRLASGIHRELAEEPPYSFAKEEEERVCRKAQAQEGSGCDADDLRQCLCGPGGHGRRS